MQPFKGVSVRFHYPREGERQAGVFAGHGLLVSITPVRGKATCRRGCRSVARFHYPREGESPGQQGFDNYVSITPVRGKGLMVWRFCQGLCFHYPREGESDAPGPPL